MLKMYYLAITSYSPFDGARTRRNKLIATNVGLSSESDELWKYEISRNFKQYHAGAVHMTFTKS